MPSKSLSRGGLRVSYPDTHTALRRPPDSRDRGLQAQTVHDVLLKALQDNAFETVDEVQLAPARQRDLGAPGARPGRPGPDGAAPAGSASLALDLPQDESAVVLVEQDGCYSWHLPQDAPSVTGTRTRSIGPRRVTFEVPLAAASADRTRGLLGNLVSGVVRMTVLKFAAPWLAGKAIAFLERDVHPGLVVIKEPSPATWARVETLADVGLPSDRPTRVLLFVHGTFSSTQHAFGILGCTPDGTAWLNRALAAYDAVIGYDHPTLSVDPLANATDLLRRVNGHAGQVTFDVVCHSRGGLTTRSFAEQVLPSSGWGGRVDRAVFVAATNGGTHLADPDRWRDLIDVTTNIATVGASVAAGLPGGAPVAALVGGVVRGLGALVKYLAGYLLDDGGIPGLAAMMPNGPFVTELNRTQPGQPGPGTSWFVAQSNFHVTLFDDSHRPPEFPRELAVRLAEGAVDQLFKGPNDLVVDVASMSRIDPGSGPFVADTLDFGTNDVVYHGNYFHQARFSDAIGRWLLDDHDRGLTAARPPDDGEATAEPPAGEGEEPVVDRSVDMPPPRPLPPPLLPPPAAGEPTTPPRIDVEGTVAIELPEVSDGVAGDAADEPARELPDEPGGETAGEPGGETAGEGSAALADDTTQPEPTTAHLLAEMAAKPLVDKPTPLRVALSRSEIQAMITDGAVGAATFVARPDRALGVQVVGKSNCTISGPDTDTITLPSGRGTSEVRFDVVPQAPGPIMVTVIVRDGDVPLAMLTLQATATERAGRSQATVRATATADTDAGAAPDLSSALWLEILQTEQAGDTTFQYTVRAPDLGLLQRFSSPVLHDIEGFVTELFRDVRQSFADHGAGPAFLSALQDRGAQLFDELFPEPLRKLLWANRSALDRLVLLADEPYLPWELVHLKPTSGRRPSKPAFLGQLGLVRWQFTGFPRATLRARTGKVHTVCPEYLDPAWALAGTAQEAAFLGDRLGATPVPATERDVQRVLRSGGFDILHFCGHGMADPTDIAAAKIMLTGRKTRGGAITPQYLTATTVAQNAQLRDADGSGPLVVLNACQTGRGGEQLSSLGGFARAFLQAGATAFVSTLWSVGDAPARDFVETLYDRLIAGDPIGHAARAAREAARSAGDATWLAYVVYARPDARLVRT